MSEDSLTPEEIREIRGERTQAAFAELLGVSPITVYRWELPSGEGQSRTPRKGMQTRIRALADGAEPEPERTPAAEPTPPNPPEPRGPEPHPGPRELAPEHLEKLLPILDAVFACRWREAEEAVLPYLQDPDMCLGMRSFSQMIVAMVQVLERADGRAAFSSLQAAAEAALAGKLPSWIAARVHVTAALVFGFPDGQIFHPGRVNAHVAAAQALLPRHGEEDMRMLLHLAELSGAKHQGDQAELLRVLGRGRKLGSGDVSPLVRCMALKLRAVHALSRGRLPEATSSFEELAESADELGFSSVQFAALVLHAWLGVLGEVHVDELSTLLVRARRVADRARLVPGVYDCILEGVSSELHFRRGDFEGAREALRRADLLEARIGWPVNELLFSRLRFHTLTQDPESLEHLLESFPAMAARHSLPFEGVSRAAIKGYLMVARGELREAWCKLYEASGLARELQTVPWLEACVTTLAFYLTMLSGDIEKTRAARRVAERSLSRFPARWISAHFRQFLGVFASALGQGRESAQHHDAALETFRRCGDRVQAALTNRCLAASAYVRGEPHAEELMASSEARLAELGLQVPHGVRVEWIEKMRANVVESVEMAVEEIPSSELVVPLQRLTQRGLSREEVAEELLSVIAELIGERPLWVCRLDGEGCASGVCSRGQHEGEEEKPDVFFEFADGAGLRFRLGIQGPLPEAHRSVVSTLVMVAEQSLEIGSLRSFSGGAEVAEAELPDAEVPGVVAVSPQMKGLVQDLVRLRNSRASVLITGESGTGKEVVARLLHESSVREKKPYVTFNCSAVPRELFEGQLFGHRKGAFTGADRDHPGVIRAANGGTLFLDEIGDLPLDLQPKLLRFLENQEIFPLGETRAVPVDVRVVAATHKDLAALVREGSFREDLFFRLQVVPVHLPPLRERQEDIVPLVRHFLASLTPEGEEPPRLSPEVISSLLAHDWPGNVREVRNTVERALAYHPVPAVLGADHLRPAVNGMRAAAR